MQHLRGALEGATGYDRVRDAPFGEEPAWRLREAGDRCADQRSSRAAENEGPSPALAPKGLDRREPADQEDPGRRAETPAATMSNQASPLPRRQHIREVGDHQWREPAESESRQKAENGQPRHVRAQSREARHRREKEKRGDEEGSSPVTVGAPPHGRGADDRPDIDRCKEKGELRRGRALRWHRKYRRQHIAEGDLQKVEGKSKAAQGNGRKMQRRQRRAVEIRRDLDLVVATRRLAADCPGSAA